MATWETNTVKSNFNVNSSIDTRMAARDAARSNFSGNTPIREYSVVGLNIESVDGMRAEIRVWVDKIKNHLDRITSTGETSVAFRSSDGEVEKAVEAYVRNCKDYCMNLASDLLAFSDKLADVKNAWMQSTSAMSSTITSDAQATDAGSAYQETL